VKKKLSHPATRVTLAELGDAAGLIGAASLNMP
jgi:hypothetical protein